MFLYLLRDNCTHLTDKILSNKSITTLSLCIYLFFFFKQHTVILGIQRCLQSLDQYTMEYYSAIKKNTFESVLMRQMKLEPIIQSEVSQKEKHQYSILTHIYRIQKDGNDNPVCETARDTDVQNNLLDSVGEGEGGMIWENGIETCIIS